MTLLTFPHTAKDGGSQHCPARFEGQPLHHVFDAYFSILDVGQGK